MWEASQVRNPFTPSCFLLSFPGGLIVQAVFTFVPSEELTSAFVANPAFSVDRAFEFGNSPFLHCGTP